MKFHSIAAGIATLLVAAGAANADVIVVNPGPGTPVQDAINLASAGDEIVLMPGEYTETLDFLGKAITVRSDAGASVTSINAQGLGPVVRFATGEAAASVLEGLTLTGGAGEFRGQIRVGGAVYVDGASPTIIGCEIRNNTADFGGAIAVLAGAAPLVQACAFDANTADQGGAAYVLDADPGFLGCSFHANAAEFRGGAMLVDGDAAPQVVNAVFAGSAAEKLDGGAAACLRNAAPVFVNCVFTGNTADCGGGGLYAFHASHPALVHATVVGNAAAAGAGVLAESTADGSVSNSILAGANGGTLAGADLDVNYSLVQGGWSGGVGNIMAPPRLLDPNGADDIIGTLDDDVRLAPGSPAIDAASGDLLPVDAVDADRDGDRSERIQVDLGFAPRAVDAAAYADIGVPAANGATPDMGALEAGAGVPPFCLCDVDSEAGVGILDLLAYLDSWFDREAGAELTGDQPASVDVFDLLIYLDCWFVGCA